jgi:hypothetical protein
MDIVESVCDVGEKKLTDNSESILREHNVVLAKYGQDLYVQQITVKSNYPTEKGRKEKCLRLIGNLEELMSENPEQHEIILTVDGAEELKQFIELWLKQQKGDSVS